MSKGKIIGYKRVSSIDQNEARQLEGLELDKVFIDKVSGKDNDRPQLQAMLDSGDVGTTELAKIVNALASSQSSLATQSTKASMLKLGTNTDTVLHNASKDIQERLKSNAESTVIDTSKY